MIEVIIRHFEEKRKYLIRDLAIISRLQREFNPYRREVRDNTVKSMRRRIREYDMFIDYLKSIKGKCE